MEERVWLRLRCACIGTLTVSIATSIVLGGLTPAAALVALALVWELFKP